MSDNISNEEMQTVMPPGIGEQLKAAREERKLTLLEISDNIHIKVSYLEALERDDYEHMPVAIYTKNYIKKYGNYLGLDGDQLAERFQSVSKQYSSFPSNSVPASEKVLRKNKERAKKAEEGDIMPRHWFVFALVILGVIVALVKITGHARQEKKAREAAIKEQKTLDSNGDTVPRDLQIIRSVKQEFNFAEKLPEVD
ncbi:helix-turn-helix domain-containing protein [bacterium]|nr:helix-turn-helix domain-containing protein [bacterium]